MDNESVMSNFHVQRNSPFEDVTRSGLGARVRRYAIHVFTGIAVVAVLIYGIFAAPPEAFPAGSTVHVVAGTTTDAIAKHLHAQNVIKSPTALKTVLSLFGSDTGVQAGVYHFKRPANIFGVTRSLVRGDFGIEPVTVRIPEGATVREMAEVFSDRLGDSFDPDAFVRIAQQHEGYLFPDTYRFLPTVSEREIVRTLRRTFDEKIANLEEDIEQSGRPLEEIIIMASLLEKEARTTHSRRVIAGILWKRIEIDMPLQVDAAFLYINGKSTFDLTREDLALDHPYNTYKHRGLPAGPIANPSLDSIHAAVHPIESDYLYYLSDMHGNMHYAENFEVHKQNKWRYLN